MGEVNRMPDSERCACCGSSPEDRRPECERGEVERLRGALSEAMRFLLKAGFVLPQHAVERDRLIDKYDGANAR